MLCGFENPLYIVTPINLNKDDRIILKHNVIFITVSPLPLHIMRFRATLNFIYETL